MITTFFTYYGTNLVFPVNVEEDINMKIVNIWKFLEFMSMAKPLPPGKDEWQMPYPSGTEKW